MGGGLLFIGIGALFAFYGMRFVRDKSTNYRFTKGLTLLGLTIVCWGTFPQAQRFNSGTQIFAQLIVGLLFFGVGGAVVGFLIDWYRKQNKDLNSESDPRSLQGGELDSKAKTISGQSLQLNPTYQSKIALSAADLVRLEQITSLRDRGTLSQSQFEMERDNILGAAEPISKEADAAPKISPPPPPPTSPESTFPAGTSVQKGGGPDVGFIAVMLLPFLLMGLLIFGGVTESSPDEAPARMSEAELPASESNLVGSDPVVDNCYGSVERENWSAAIVYCGPVAERGDPAAQTNVGFMYDMGKGVAENNVEAVRWYRRAAEQGDNVAQYNLGTMYESGEGVEENLNEAESWYRKSAKQGHEDAKKRLEELATANSSTNQQNAAIYEKESEEFSDPAFDEGIAYLLNAANAAGSDSFYANQYSAYGDYVRQDIIATLRSMTAGGPTGGNSFAVYNALAEGEMYPSCRTRGRLNHSCVDTQRTFSFKPNPSLARQIKRKKGCYSASNPGC